MIKTKDGREPRETERAYRDGMFILPYLINYLKSNGRFKTRITYQNFGEMTGIHYEWLGDPLGRIWHVAVNKNLPFINSFVVNNVSGIPGHLESKDEAEKQIDAVSKYKGDWNELGKQFMEGLMEDYIDWKKRSGL